MDTTETGSYDNKLPPPKEIVRRNLKNSPKRRINRPLKSKLRKYYEAHGDICILPDATEEIHHSLEQQPLATATQRTASLYAIDDKVRPEEEPAENYADLTHHKLLPNGVTTTETWYSEIHKSSSKTLELVPSRERQVSVTQLPPVIFPSDLPKAVSSALDKYQKRSERTLKPLAESSGSSRSSMSCSSISSVEQESLDHVEHDVTFSPGNDSDEFDTDCELEITSEFRAMEVREKLMQQDSDIGHITYERICQANNLLPRSQVKRQLWEKKLNLRYAGLLPAEVKAVAASLKTAISSGTTDEGVRLPFLLLKPNLVWYNGRRCERNNRIEEIDLSYNSMTEETVTFVIEILQCNTYITKLNLAGSVLEITAAMACCKLLTQNMSLLHLNLSECSIGDSEIGYLAQGIQVNHVLLQLNLSKNKIGLVGALQLARALGENATLVFVDLSWNHIRGGGAVALGNSLKKNRRLEELDISWNGFGFEGSIAFGETLRVNKTLKILNMESNRITWDGAPYLAKGLAVNRTLEVLQIGRNPMSMQGCEEILKALAKPTSRIRLLSLKDIPINTKIALKASDIAKYREFTLQHGGILNTRDVIGFQRPRREDPFVLLIRYLSLMGIRVVDLFRMFDKNNDLFITKEKFVQGLQRVRVPLEDGDLLLVAKRLRSNKRGEISYKELASAVRNRIIKTREECKRQEMVEIKKRDEKLRILQLDKPQHGTGYITSSYSQYRQRQRKSSLATGDSIRRDSDFATLPPIKNGRSFNLVEMFSAGKRSQKLTRQKIGSHDDNSAPFPNKTKVRLDSESEYEQIVAIGNQGSGSSYGKHTKLKHDTNVFRRHKYM